MIFLITALLLLLNTQIVPTQAMELTSTSSEEENNEKLKNKKNIDITTLNLSDNNIEYLPAQIVILTALRSLILTNNELTTIHENITKLTNLTSLDLSGNDKLSISASLGEKLLALPKLDQQSKDGIKKYIKN